VANLTSIKRP